MTGDGKGVMDGGGRGKEGMGGEHEEGVVEGRESRKEGKRREVAGGMEGRETEQKAHSA